MKCWAGWVTSWNQDCKEKYQKPQLCRWHHTNDRKQRGTKESLDEGERGEWKSWLKTQHSENEDHGIQSHPSVPKWKSLHCVWLFVTPWAIQSMDFSRAEYWSGEPFPSPGDLPNPGIEPRSLALQEDSLPLSHQGSPRILEWVAYSFSYRSSPPRNQTGVSCIAGRFFTNWAIRETQCHHFMATRLGKNENSDRLFFLGSKNHCRWWLQPWN